MGRQKAAPIMRFAKFTEKNYQLVRKLISLLPDHIAAKVARENALRIYHLDGGGGKIAALRSGRGSGKGKGRLSGPAIRSMVSGNTLNFAGPQNGRNI